MPNVILPYELAVPSGHRYPFTYATTQDYNDLAADFSMLYWAMDANKPLASVQFQLRCPNVPLEEPRGMAGRFYMVPNLSRTIVAYMDEVHTWGNMRHQDLYTYWYSKELHSVGKELVNRLHRYETEGEVATVHFLKTDSITGTIKILENIIRE